MTGLTVYQRDHLEPVYREVADTLLPVFLRASLAHVVMLAEQGLLDRATSADYLHGLRRLEQGNLEKPEYDGSFEDAYFVLESLLAEAIGVPGTELGLQLARSRNDLDAAAFRLILRDQVIETLAQVHRFLRAALSAADRHAEVVILGFTHRRPAQPTTIGHVLSGFAEAALAHATQLAAVLDQLGASPLGACAFAGTDLPISRERLAELLGFHSLLTNSYQAVAGADHFAQLASANAHALASGARLSRTLLEWLTEGWVRTPAEFCQGSSIMPQKQNPVVLEHLVSLANREIGDAQFVLGNIAAAWWEDSNNATTDVQPVLWASNDRARRFFSLLARFLEILEVQTPPSESSLVAAGATTTTAADALSLAGVPFRAAHALVGQLSRTVPPTEWTPSLVVSGAAAAGPAVVVDEVLAESVVDAVTTPLRVLRRTQGDGPGSAAVRAQVGELRTRLAVLEAELLDAVALRENARVLLDAAVDTALEVAAAEATERT